MDPIESIRPEKDSTFALMLEAQKRGYEIIYFTLSDLVLKNEKPMGYGRYLEVFDHRINWFKFKGEEFILLDSLDLILMRKDPPFTIEYIMATYILQKAQDDGTMIINNAQALRDVNEKVYTAWFPQCCPEGLITRSKKAIKSFLDEHQKIVIKPTDKMAGQSIFVISKGDPNTHVIIEEVTKKESVYVQVQVYLPQIKVTGDKRILLIDGIPIDYGIRRIPDAEDHRGNMAAGASVKGFQLTEQDVWICEQIGPELKKRGLFFVGIDVIGDHLTEINVTSPTGIREIDALFDLNIAAVFFDKLEEKLSLKPA
jgi:glutathione synthase